MFSSAKVGHIHVCTSIALVSTGVWFVAHWDWWIIDVEASSWGVISIELLALLIGWAESTGSWSWRSRSRASSSSGCSSSVLAIIEEASSGVKTSLLIFNSFALCDNSFVIIEVWSMSTDVHLFGDSNTSAVRADLPLAFIKA